MNFVHSGLVFQLSDTPCQPPCSTHESFQHRLRTVSLCACVMHGRAAPKIIEEYDKNTFSMLINVSEIIGRAINHSNNSQALDQICG